MKKHYLLILILSFTLLLFSGCTTNESESASYEAKPIVVVSIVPQKAFVDAVAGDTVETVVMIPPGASPTNYQPSPKELAKLSEADIYFTIGVPAEQSILPKILDINPDIKTIHLDEIIEATYPARFMDAHDHEEEHHDHDEEHHDTGAKDPHIWLSPRRVQIMVDAITDELSKEFPEHKSLYETNADAYKTELDQLIEYTEAILKDVDNKSFIIYHPSYGYYADDFDLDMVPVEEGGKEATVKNLQNVIDFAKDNDIKVIFYQNEISSAQADTLAREIDGYTYALDPLSYNYIEEMKKLANTFAELLDD